MSSKLTIQEIKTIIQKMRDGIASPLEERKLFKEWDHKIPSLKYKAAITRVDYEELLLEYRLGLLKGFTGKGKNGKYYVDLNHEHFLKEALHNQPL